MEALVEKAGEGLNLEFNSFSCTSNGKLEKVLGWLPENPHWSDEQRGLTLHFVEGEVEFKVCHSSKNGCGKVKSVPLSELGSELKKVRSALKRLEKFSRELSLH